MSLIGSISTAITGLVAQSTSLGNVSDNLANSSTVGYKTIGTNFSDLVSTAKVPDVGTGVRATPAYYNSQQGSLTSVTMETYLAVSGRGFFPVTVADPGGVQPTGDEVLYTRSGDFCLNNGGYLANSEGYCLMGWNVDSQTGTVNQGALVPISISELIEESVPTSHINYESNLPASVAVGTTPPDAKVTIYDDRPAEQIVNKNNEHDVTYSWEKTGQNEWGLTISAPGGGSPDFTTHATFTFDTNGKIISITSPDSTASLVAYDRNGEVVPVDSSDRKTASATLTFNLSYAGASAQTITAEFGKVTQFADTAVSLSAFDQNGVTAGSFTNININEDGYVSLNYSNGVSRIYYQVPLATFNAPEQLQRQTGTAFRITEASGDVAYNAAGTNGAGKMVSNALENSTVDIAQQFTVMIQAQQAYSANARTISTADSMLETLIMV